MDYLNENSIKINQKSKSSEPPVLSDSLCSIENVLLPSIGSANEDLTFVSLPNRKRILEEIANNIAERKHTFLTVSAFKVYINLNSYISKMCIHPSVLIGINLDQLYQFKSI